MGFFKKSKKENASQPAESGDVHAARGLKALNVKDNNLALTELEQAVELGLEKYNLAEIYTILGRTYKNLGQLDEAVAAHKKSLEMDPNYEKAWNNLGNTYMALNQYAEAEQAMEKAIECDPTYVFAMGSLGAVYINRGKADKAVDVLEQAIALSPKMTVLHVNLAQAYAKVGRFTEARQSLEQAKGLGYANWQTIQKRIDAGEAKAPKPAPKPTSKVEGVYPLEKIRVELERVRMTIGSAADYLDRGNPSPEDRARTEAAIREHEKKAQALETEFNALLDDYRKQNPALVKMWAGIHLEILNEIVAKIDTSEVMSVSSKTDLNFATRTANEWQDVLEGKRNYVRINHFILKEYNRLLSEKLPELDLKK